MKKQKKRKETSVATLEDDVVSTGADTGAGDDQRITPGAAEGDEETIEQDLEEQEHGGPIE